MTTTKVTPLYVECLIQQEHYAFSISTIQEIIPMHEVTVLPGKKKNLRGVINLRGNIIPIYCLRSMLNIPSIANTKHTRIIIAQLAGKTLGLVVDCVSRVIGFSEVKPVTEQFGHKGNIFLHAIGELEGNFVGILDMQELFLQEVRGYE
ncbi:chemotaxis protein CheW [Paenibacillus roseipurpureus]|uniref:Chemotaxis protein CheW n=1 Tax=Paenibacillus roseopurpureus TaxID=2918901 RepID=A0AA96LMY2_9BACL|nr:chemotaxis protein CheW [Paenibacillus sp. MBLB1832]WNR42673.1 chemotaxis protein CheW [Paenibacillus sp. MBLB1832]